MSRLAVPLWISALGGNILITVGLALYSQAISLFLHGKTLRPLWFALAVCCVGVVVLYPLDYALRTSAYALMGLLMLAPGVWQIVRYGWYKEPSLRMVALTLGLCGLGFVMRSVQGWADPHTFGDLLEPGKGPGVTFLMAFICMLGSGFGFILAALAR